jgi:hypothetical protein
LDVFAAAVSWSISSFFWVLIQFSTARGLYRLTSRSSSRQTSVISRRESVSS